MTFPNPLAGTGVGDPLSGGAGSGFTGTGTLHKTRVTREGDLLKAEIFVDLTGLELAAAGDIIGGNDLTNCHLGLLLPAQMGTLLRARHTPLEVPAGGDPDIDIYEATEATGTENDPITGLAETLLLDGGDWAANTAVDFTTLPTAGKYLYLVGGAGATVFGTYTAGQTLIELWGYR